MAQRRWSFLVPILVFAATCLVVTWLILFGLGIAFTALHGVLVAWFAMMTIGLHAWQEPAMVTDPKGFVRRFMAALMLKMVLSVALLVLVLLRVANAEVVPAALVFAFLYLAFLTFSTARLIRLSRKRPAE